MKKPLHNFRRYYRLVPRYGFHMVVLIVLDLAGAVLAMVPPLFAVLVFDRAIPLRSSGWLFIAVAGGLISYLLYFLVTAVGDYWNARLDARVTAALAVEGFRRIEETSFEKINRLKVGDLTDRLVNASDVISGLLVNLPSRLVISLLQIAIFIVVSFWLDRAVIWLGLASVPFYFIESRYFGERLRRSAEKVRERSSHLYEGLQEKLHHLKSIKTFSCEEKERLKIEGLFQQWGRELLGQKWLGIKQAFANSLTLQVWTAAMTLLLGTEVLRGQLTVGEMITLAIYLSLIQQPIRDLCALWGQSKAGEASLDRFRELEQLPREGRPPAKEGGVPEGIFQEDLIFKNVRFSFDRQPVLKNLNARIPARKLTAVVGPSGIGKSSMAHLILGLYRVSDGSISFGGQDVAGLPLAMLRQHVGILFQEPPLFSGTVRENIAYGHEGLSLDRVKEAARLAQADSFISQMPAGYDSPLLWGGGNLSAGQKQRMALARTLLHQPDLLILDEPSSALDAEAAFHLGEVLHSLKSKMTILLLSHSFSAVKQADQILFLDDGCVREQGTFDALMNQKGAFFDLYQIQTGGFQDFQRRFEIEMERHRRYKQSVALLLFKIPEELVEKSLRFIRRHLRVMDFAAQYLKDQIIIGLPETDTAALQQALDRLSKLLKKEGITFKAGGAALAPEENTYTEALFNAAEREMNVSC